MYDADAKPLSGSQVLSKLKGVFALASEKQSGCVLENDSFIPANMTRSRRGLSKNEVARKICSSLAKVQASAKFRSTEPGGRSARM